MTYKADHLTGISAGHANRQNRQRLNRVITALCAIAALAATAPAILAQCAPPPAGTMVAWYPLDQLGFSANMATGNNGTWSSPPPQPVYGKVGVALQFDGASTYVDSTTSIVTNFGVASTPTCAGGDNSTCPGDFSIEAWVNIPVRPSLPEAIVDKRGPGPVGYSFYINANRIGLQIADPYIYVNLDSKGVSWTLGEWHHVAVTVKRGGPQLNGIIHYYFDGNSAGTAVPLPLYSLANDGPLRIGANGPDNPGGFFKGDIDEVAIYNRVLTAAEVEGIYNAGAYGKCLP